MQSMQDRMPEFVAWKKANKKTWPETAAHFQVNPKSISNSYHHWKNSPRAKAAKKKAVILRKAAAPRFVDIPLVTQDDGEDITIIRCKVKQIASVLGGF